MFIIIYYVTIFVTTPFWTIQPIKNKIKQTNKNNDKIKRNETNKNNIKHEKQITARIEYIP